MMALLLLFLPAISAYILPHLQLQTRYPRIFKVYSTNTNIISSSSALEWVDSKDIKNNEIKITINPSSGICIAKSALKDSDIMFSLPQGLCLDPEKAERKFGSVISASQLRTGSLGMVSLLLLSEVSLESESKYSAYIRSLPTKTPGILGFPINELKEFVASTTRNIRSQLAAIEEDIETILSNKQLLSMFPDGSIDRERLKWAIGTTKARSVYIDGSPVLVPGMDFIPFDPLCDREPQSVSAGVFGGKASTIFLLSYDQAIFINILTIIII